MTGFTVQFHGFKFYNNYGHDFFEIIYILQDKTSYILSSAKDLCMSPVFGQQECLSEGEWAQDAGDVSYLYCRTLNHILAPQHIRCHQVQSSRLQGIGDFVYATSFHLPLSFHQGNNFKLLWTESGNYFKVNSSIKKSLNSQCFFKLCGRRLFKPYATPHHLMCANSTEYP